MSDQSSNTGSSSSRPQQDVDEQQQQQSPHQVPSSPHLRPRAHRSASPTASSSTATTSSSTLAHPDNAPASTSQSPESSGSSSSRGSLSERGTTTHRGDLTASVISNLDLNEYMASPSLRGQVDDATSSLDEADVLKLREGVAKRLPLVREDTSTRRAIEGLTLPGTQEQGPSPVIGTSPTTSQPTEDFPHHPMFDRLEPPNLGLGATSSSTFSREPSAGAGLTAFEPSGTSDFSGPQDTDHPHHHQHHESRYSDEDQEYDDDSRAAHQPKTTSGTSHVQTVPTVSATGMPRLFHRHADDPTLQSHYGSQGAPPKELLPEGDEPSDSDSESDASSTTSSSSRGGSTAHTHAPTGSLILTALSPSSQISWGRRLAILSSSFFVNLGLPFINGVCLGFGEIFARTLVAPLVLGIVNTRWPSLTGGGGGTRSGSGGGNGGVTTNVGRTRGEREELRRETGSGRGIGTAGVGVRATSSY